MKDTGPKSFVFVLMPFDSAFNDIYQLGIKETCDNAGAYAERVDEQTYDGTVTQRIYNQIAKADIIVADMTGRNPNVFYEVGYAHALDKRVILLTRCVDDIPFDLKDHPHIVYGTSIQYLREELLKKLQWAIENPRKDVQILAPPVEFYIDRIPLYRNPLLQLRQHNSFQLDLYFDAHNSAKHSIRPVQFRLCLLSSDIFTHMDESKRRFIQATCIPGGGRMHILDKTFTILPGGWESGVDLRLHCIDEKTEVFGLEHKFTLRMLTEGPPVDIPFRVLVEPIAKQK